MKEKLLAAGIMIVFLLVGLSGCTENINSGFDIDRVEVEVWSGRTYGNWMNVFFTCRFNQKIDDYDIELKEVDYTLYGNNMFFASRTVEYLDISFEYVSLSNRNENYPDNPKEISQDIIPKEQTFTDSTSLFEDVFLIGVANVDTGIYDWAITCNQALKDIINQRWIGEDVPLVWDVSGEISFYVDGEYYSIEFSDSTDD